MGRADEIRASVPAGASVADDVARIIAGVRSGGDAALEEFEVGFGAGARAPFTAEAGVLDDAVRAGLEVAIHNVRAVAEAGLDDDRLVTLPQGHSVKLRDVPVRRAAVYAPGGRNPYPSTVVMGVVTARAAGVDEVYVVGAPHPVMVAAAELCGADAYFAVTGAQAVAALAYGTESIPKVDVIVGPGSLWVQEAKRQVSGVVGIDGFAGPSDLTVVATAGADLEALKADLAGQAEHGEGSLTVAVERRPGDPGRARRPALGAARHGRGPGVRRGTRARAPATGGRRGRGARAAHPVRRLPVRGFGEWHRVRRLRRGFEPRPAHRGRRALRLRPERAPLPAPDGGGPRGLAGAALAAAGVPIAEAEAFPAHAASMGLRQNPRP